MIDARWFLVLLATLAGCAAGPPTVFVFPKHEPGDGPPALQIHGRLEDLRGGTLAGLTVRGEHYLFGELEVSEGENGTTFKGVVHCFLEHGHALETDDVDPSAGADWQISLPKNTMLFLEHPSRKIYLGCELVFDGEIEP